jgi:hypothetical protein
MPRTNSKKAPAKVLTTDDFLRQIHRRGARRIRVVRFRDNRSTVWSLTRRGTVLNVHVAFQRATSAILDAFATVAREGGIGSAASRRAADRISSWPELERALRSARRRHATRQRRAAQRESITHCCATPEQRAYLRTLYRYFNLTRFDGRLPDDIPVRLSARMRSALGHMVPGETTDGGRYVVEIALNVDLMLVGNGAERADTLLHEMAHVADYLESGNRGHGASWREWARRVGARPLTLYDRPVATRRRRRDSVTRVPPLPRGLWKLYPAGQSQPKTPAVKHA